QPSEQRSDPGQVDLRGYAYALGGPAVRIAGAAAGAGTAAGNAVARLRQHDNASPRGRVGARLRTLVKGPAVLPCRTTFRGDSRGQVVSWVKERRESWLLTRR